MKEESDFKGGKTEFVKTKLMTRLTYTLDEVRNACVYFIAASPAGRRAPCHALVLIAPGINLWLYWAASVALLPQSCSFNQWCFCLA